MDYALKERIGEPELFTGRKKELDYSPVYAKSFSLDIFARARSANDYSIIGEVKSRNLREFSREEAVRFLEKLREVKSLERVERAVGFIFSHSGFTREAEDYCKEMGIACSEDERWLGGLDPSFFMAEGF